MDQKEKEPEQPLQKSVEGFVEKWRTMRAETHCRGKWGWCLDQYGREVVASQEEEGLRAIALPVHKKNAPEIARFLVFAHEAPVPEILEGMLAGFNAQAQMITSMAAEMEAKDECLIAIFQVRDYELSMTDPQDVDQVQALKKEMDMIEAVLSPSTRAKYGFDAPVELSAATEPESPFERNANGEIICPCKDQRPDVCDMACDQEEPRPIKAEIEANNEEAQAERQEEQCLQEP